MPSFLDRFTKKPALLTGVEVTDPAEIARMEGASVAAPVKTATSFTSNEVTDPAEIAAMEGTVPSSRQPAIQRSPVSPNRLSEIDKTPFPKNTSTNGIASPNDQQAGRTAKTIKSDLTNFIKTAPATIPAGATRGVGSLQVSAARQMPPGFMPGLGYADSEGNPVPLDDTGDIFAAPDRSFYSKGNPSLEKSGMEKMDTADTVMKQIRQEAPIENKTIDTMLREGVYQAGAMLPTLPLAAIPGVGPEIAVQLMSQGAGADAIRKAKELNLAPDEADDYFRKTVIPEYAGERLSIGPILKLLSARAPFFKAMTPAILTEIGGELGTSHFQHAADKAYEKPGLNKEERDRIYNSYLNMDVQRKDPAAMKEWVDMMKDTALTTAGMVGTMGAAGAVHRGAASVATTPQTDPLTGNLNFAPPTAVPGINPERAGRTEKLARIMEGETPELAQQRLQNQVVATQQAPAVPTVETEQEQPINWDEYGVQFDEQGNPIELEEALSNEQNIQKAIQEVPTLRQDLPESRELPMVSPESAIPAPQSIGISGESVTEVTDPATIAQMEGKTISEMMDYGSATEGFKPERLNFETGLMVNPKTSKAAVEIPITSEITAPQAKQLAKNAGPDIRAIKEGDRYYLFNTAKISGAALRKQIIKGAHGQALGYGTDSVPDKGVPYAIDLNGHGTLDAAEIMAMRNAGQIGFTGMAPNMDTAIAKIREMGRDDADIRGIETAERDQEIIQNRGATNGNLPSMQQEGGEGQAQVPDVRPENVAPSKSQAALDKHNQLVEPYNALVRDYKAAQDPTKKAQIKSRLDALNLEMRTAQGELQTAQMEEFKNSRREDARDKYGAMEIGTKVGKIGYDANTSYWTKVADNKWQSTLGGINRDVFTTDEKMEGNAIQSEAKGRSLFTAEQLKEFDKRGIDVSKVPVQYKEEALQQIQFQKEQEDKLASPDYNDQVQAEYDRIAEMQKTSGTVKSKPATAKQTQKRKVPRNFLTDIKQEGGINLSSITKALDVNEVRGPKGKGNRYLRVTGANGVGIDQMAMQMQDAGWQVPTDIDGRVDANGFAQMLKDAVNGDLPVHPDDADMLAEAAAKKEEIERLSQLTDDDLEVYSLLDAETLEVANLSFDDIMADLWEDLSGDDYEAVNKLISDAVTEVQTRIQGVDYDRNAKGDGQTDGSPTGETESGSGVADETLGESQGGTQAETNVAPPSEVVSSSGEVQNKLFATPPTFGKKPQGGKSTSTGDLIDGFTNAKSVQPDLVTEKEAIYNEGHPDNPYTVSEISSADTGNTDTGSAGGVREQFALFTATGEPTPQARQIVKIADQQVKTFSKTAQVITGQIRTGLTHVETPQDLAHVMAGIRKKTQENFVIVVTDKDNKIVGVIDQTTGSVNQSIVHPSLVLGASSLIKDAKNIWLVHNHPTGDPTFSPEDKKITQRISKVGEGSGLVVRGIMAIGLKTADFYDGYAWGAFPIPAMARTKILPVEGARSFVKRPAADQARITAPDQLEPAMKDSGISGEGVVLLDGKNRIVGFVPMEGPQMGRLKTGDTGSGSGLLIKSIRQTNAVAMIAVSSQMDKARNIGSFGDVLGVKLLDIYDPETNKSAATLGLGTNNGDSFYSLGKYSPAGIKQSAAQSAINPLLSSWKNAPPVEVVQAESDLPPGLIDQIQSIGAEGMVRGVFDEGKVYLISDNLRSNREAIEVLLHETVGHFGVRGLLGKQFDPMLKQVAMVYGRKGLQDIARRYGLDLNDPEDLKIAAEEKLAEMAETGEKPDVIKRVVAMIKDWLRKVGINLKWTDADIKAMINRARGWVERGKAKATVFDGELFSVAGKDQTETPAFRKWFGDSKVVDDHGKPLVVYHGTNDSFSSFGREIDLNLFRNLGMGDGHFYFTDSPETAATYANDEGQNIMPVYLSLQNPLEIDGGGKTWIGQIRKALIEADNQGKDGVIIRNVVDDLEGDLEPSTVYVALKQTQIKSATGNNGDFDSKNPDIRFSLSTKAADKFQSTDPNVQRRYDAAHGLDKGPGLVERLTELKDRAISEMQHFPELDMKRDAQTADILRVYESSQQAATAKTVAYLQSLTRDLSPNEMNMFEWRVLLDDLTEEANKGRALPFGYTPDTLAADHEQIMRQTDSNPKIKAAIDRRQQEQQRIVKEMVEKGLLPESVLESKNYFRHMVLEYANAKKWAGLGTKELRNRKRGWQKQREGSELDINTNFLEAEFEVYSQQLKELATKETLEKVEKINDITPKLKSQAKATNFENLVGGPDIVKRIRSLEAESADIRGQGELDNTDKEQLAKIGEELDQLDPTRPFKRSMAIGFSKLQKLAERGELPEGKGKLKGIAQALASGEPTDRLFNYLADLASSADDAPGTKPARQVLSAIAKLDKLYRETLGAEYLEHKAFIDRRLIPEDHVEWQPEKGNVFHRETTLPEKIVDRAIAATWSIEELVNSGLLKDAVILGGRKKSLILPDGVAKTLDNLRFERESAVLDTINKKLIGGWKVWTLLSPRRVIKYNLNNMSGDLDAALAADPKMLKYMRDAWRNALERRKGKLSADDLDMIDRGVLDSGISVNEIPDINQLPIFKGMSEEQRRSKLWNALSKGDLSVLAPANLITKYFDKISSLTNIREGLLREAAYRRALELLQEGKPVLWASNKTEIDAIPDNKDKAAKLARELIGDYGNISAHGERIRARYIPFWSWMEINAPRYYRIFRNAAQEGGKYSAGARLAGVAGKKMIGTTVGVMEKVVLTQILFALVSTFNHLVFGGDDDDDRGQLRLNLYRDNLGRTVSARFQGAFSDALSWFGLEDYTDTIKKMNDGSMDATDLAKKIAMATPNKIVNASVPFVKLGFETLTGKSFYPNILQPRQIRDRTEHVARFVSLDNEYRAAAGKPSKGYGDTVKGMLFYTSDPKEQAYNDIRSRAMKWMKKQGKDMPGGEPTERSNALYYYKQAKRFEDKEAAQRYLAKYRELGGTSLGIKTSIRNAAPLAQTGKYSGMFIESLSAADRKKLDLALQFYRDVYAK